MGRGGEALDATNPEEQMLSSRIPGYRGFIPGGQQCEFLAFPVSLSLLPLLSSRRVCSVPSVFGKGQGAASGTGTLRTIAAANQGQQFLNYGENRCIAKSNLTLPEGEKTSLWSQGVRLNRVSLPNRHRGLAGV